MEEWTLGGDPGTGQDVTIILVPNGGSKDQKLALIHLHSHVLSTHSKYFNTCLSDRWKKPASPSPLTEFILEAQTDVQYYFDCFSSMYLSSEKTFQGVKHGVELLKVASQIDFQELMERISLYLSTMFWSEEDAIMVREYSASPDFPRVYLEDLVARLGLDESEEDRQTQLCSLARQCTYAVLKASIHGGVVLPAFFEGIGCGPPSDFSRMVIAAVSQGAKDVFVDIANVWNGRMNPSPHDADNGHRINAMAWILEALLKGQVAEELVQGIVHLNVIPQCINGYLTRGYNYFSAERQKFAEVVLLMYEEVAAGRLLLRPPERVALLVHWHAVMKTSLKTESFEQATTNLFLTLPAKQQTELINLRQENVFDYVGKVPLISLVSKHISGSLYLPPSSVARAPHAGRGSTSLPDPQPLPTLALPDPTFPPERMWSRGLGFRVGSGCEGALADLF